MMNNINLLRESLKNVNDIINDTEFKTNYGKEEQEFFTKYRKELEEELNSVVTGENNEHSRTLV